jgi:hypothetical protein
LLPACSKSVDRQGGQTNSGPLWTHRRNNATFVSALQIGGQMATMMPEKAKRAARFANLAHIFANISQQVSVTFLRDCMTRHV